MEHAIVIKKRDTQSKRSRNKAALAFLPVLFFAILCGSFVGTGVSAQEVTNGEAEDVRSEYLDISVKAGYGRGLWESGFRFV
jgi:hypothetical protein